MKFKVDNLDFIKVKDFCSLKNTMDKEVEYTLLQPACEKIFNTIIY
jgi:hypothetical protein